MGVATTFPPNHDNWVVLLTCYNYGFHSVVWLLSASCSKSTFWMVPPIFFGSQCSLAPMCFPLKISILGCSLHFLWFPVMFSSKVLSAQNQHFGWFPSLVVVPSVVWLLSAFCSKMNILGGSLHFYGSQLLLFVSNIFSIQNQHFWAVPFTFYGSQCCLAPMCFLLKPIFFSLFMVLCVVLFPVLFGSNMFSSHNQHFECSPPPLFVVPSVVWLQITLCLPCWTVRSCLDNIGVGIGILNYLKC